MQSTALALMSCENANAAQKGRAHPYPLVPVYDLVVFCDLGFEPPWVMRQAEFVHQACQDAGLCIHQPVPGPGTAQTADEGTAGKAADMV